MLVAPMRPVIPSDAISIPIVIPSEARDPIPADMTTGLKGSFLIRLVSDVRQSVPADAPPRPTLRRSMLSHLSNFAKKIRSAPIFRALVN
jgi:hypothetical protein